MHEKYVLKAYVTRRASPKEKEKKKKRRRICGTPPVFIERSIPHGNRTDALGHPPSIHERPFAPVYPVTLHEI